jgi:hypothetical protein
MEGAILLSRHLIDSEVFASEKLLKIWIWILIKANHKKRTVPIRIGGGQSVVTIGRGEMLFGRLAAENELFIDGSTIYKCIKKLEALGNIVIKSSSHYSVITICNYDRYQDINYYKVAAKKQPRNNTVTTREQHGNTLNNDNNDNNVLAEIKNIWNGNSEFDYIAKFFPKLFLLKEPLLPEQHKRLVAKYGRDSIFKVYAKMQNNRRLIQNNESAYLTSETWIDNDKPAKK